ncbi:hypothetical protein [Flavobacterium sp. Root186]|uniref:hypothetical protein n=1 Tax=Flavobacterium sp. Root186 TaxID=1736485 RepID=UPI0006FC8A81|nr:hypothetical protein [Flavobacterium sp. Root186]KRB56813.1 hypothetical protein ASD98_08995 [Flavobacterium sp. Root186]
MSKSKIILLFIFFFIWSNNIHSQGTIRLKKKPKVILHSWYPEFKEFPKLKVGESKVLFSVVPEFEKLAIRNNHIDLKTVNSQIQIEETEKRNQYIITVHSTNAKYIEFEVWLDLGDEKILIIQNGQWKKITEVYTTKDNRILLDIIKLELKR